MKHSYTVLLVILLGVITISVLFPRSRFVEGFDMDDLDGDFDKIDSKITDDSDKIGDKVDDNMDESSKKIDEIKGHDQTQNCATYTSEDGNTATICTPFKNKKKDNMDLVKAGNSVEDHDTTETFANWNP